VSEDLTSFGFFKYFLNHTLDDSLTNKPVKRQKKNKMARRTKTVHKKILSLKTESKGANRQGINNNNTFYFRLQSS